MTDQFTPQAPFQTARPTRDRGQVIGGFLLAFAGLLALPNLMRWLVSLAEYGFEGFLWQGYANFTFAIAGFVLIPLAIVGLLRSKKLVIFAGLGWVFIRLVVVTIVGATYLVPEGVFELGYVFGQSWQSNLSFVSIFVAGLAAILAQTLKSTKPTSYYDVVSVPQAAGMETGQQTGTAPGWYFDPSVGGQRYWDGSTWLNIPAPAGAALQGQPGQAAPAPGIAVAALVLAIVMPLVGLIMGYVARNQARLSPNPQAGASLIKAAITIGWIFTILGVVGSIFYGIAMATLLNQGYF